VTKTKSNSQAVLDDWYDKCRELGGQEGKKSLVKLDWWDDLAERAYRNKGVFGPDDVDRGAELYQLARNKANPYDRASRSGEGATGSDLPNRKSEAKRLLSVVSSTKYDGLKVYNQIKRLVRTDATLTGATDSLIYRLLVEQYRHDVPLTDAAMREHLVKGGADKTKKTRADRWAVHRDGMERTAKNHGGWSPHLRAAHQSVCTQIEEWGGTTKDRERTDRENARIAKKNAKKKKV
jgi:hypothetical protein